MRHESSTMERRREDLVFACGLFVVLIVFVGTFIAAVSTSDRVLSMSRVGLLLIDVGCGFLFSGLWTIVTDRGIGWAVTIPFYNASGIATRRQNRVGFWALVLLTFLISVALISGGVWLRKHPDVLESPN